MAFPAAPFHASVSYGPESGAACWATCEDGVRIRFAAWPRPGARGTVLIFPGRTEYVEKYGQVAAALAQRGLASMAVDWRGQGLSDRLAKDPMIGHVEHFADYQRDVKMMLSWARERNMPQPLFLLAHSMGGAIGLRALMEKLPVAAASFSGPMWGISMAPHVRPAAWFLGKVMPRLGRGEELPPGTKIEHHILADGFKDNLLTRDPEQFEIMRQQLLQHPDLVLGGPSFIWLREALTETRKLSHLSSPDVPCITFLGSNERIVDTGVIRRRMESWPKGSLEIVPDGEHEVLMESRAKIEPLFDRIVARFLEPIAA
ncbi:MAG: alpha/beta hydrolase [Pseudomonadota bacterium]